MRKKYLNITVKILAPTAALVILIAVWEFICASGQVHPRILPTPQKVFTTLTKELPLLTENAKVTFEETFWGLLAGLVLGFVTAVLMDRFKIVYHALYPIVVISQTIPTVAIAPLLVLWFGFGILPKVILIIMITFFPMTVNLIEGFRSADEDTINLMRSMGASKAQIFRYVKFPGALDRFFAALKISVSYALVGAVIAEWLGGFSGLGVYLTKVNSSMEYDKMYAVIILISVLSLLMILAVNILQKICMPWKNRK